MLGSIRKAWKLFRSPVKLCYYSGDVKDLEKTIAAYYNSEEADKYFELLHNNTSEGDWNDMARRDRFLDLCAKATSILDFGCGSGNLALATANKYPTKQITALDIGKRAQELFASHHLSNLQFQKGSVLSNPLPSGTFDLVISRFVIEHVVYPDLMLKEVFRLLKPNGVLFLVYPHLFLTTELKASFREFWALACHGALTYLDPDFNPPLGMDKDAVWLANNFRIKRLLHQAGFKVLHKRFSQSLFIGTRQ
jgi:ubiquinone/menaquinone biosynthesis C-methylase UbiE